MNQDELTKKVEKDKNPYDMVCLGYNAIWNSTLYNKEYHFDPYKAVCMFREAALKNHADGYFYLAYLKENGFLLFFDKEGAAQLYKKSAKLGSSRAKSALKKLGITSTTCNEAEVKRLLEESIKSDFNWVQTNGYIRDAQEKIKEKEKKALEEAARLKREEEERLELERIEKEKEAQRKHVADLMDRVFQGDKAAMYDLALCLLDGNGIDKNILTGIQYLKKLANDNHLGAIAKLAGCYITRHTYNDEPKKADILAELDPEYILNIISSNDIFDYMEDLTRDGFYALFYSDKNCKYYDKKLALKYAINYENSARNSAGSALLLEILCDIYGICHRKTYKQVLKSIEHDDPTALFLMGAYHLIGKFVRRNEYKAEQYMEKAKEIIERDNIGSKVVIEQIISLLDKKKKKYNLHY